MQNKYLIAWLVGLIFLVSCEDYSATSPEIHDVKVVSQTPIGDGFSVELVISATAENIVVWWGDKGSDYDNYQKLIGTPNLEKNVTNTYPSGQTYTEPANWDGVTRIRHVYDTSATYNLAVIAASTGDFSSDNRQKLTRMEIKPGN